MEDGYLELSSKDGLVLKGSYWEVENAKAVINLIHGFGEHCQRYRKLANRLNEEGYTVAAIDLRGHGRSDGKRGYVKSFTNLLDDVDVLLDFSASRWKDKKQFLYGHSMGGNIVSHYALKRPDKIDALIVSSPWYRLTSTPSALLMALAKALYRIFPNFIKKHQLNISYMSHDPQIVEEYLNDPLMHKHISMNLFFGVQKSGSWILENADKLSIPVYLQHGNQDQITSFNASKGFYDQAVQLNKNITFKEWEGGYHELHNETFKDEVMQAVVKWLNNQIR